jgi:hypothetical protein
LRAKKRNKQSKKKGNKMIINIPSVILAAGLRQFVPFNVPQGVSRAAVSIDATQHLNTGVVCILSAEFSYDGGQTWKDQLSTQRNGGIAVGDGGVVVNTMDFSCDIAQPNLANRRVRFQVELIGGSFTTAGGTLTLS